uniref:U14-Theraphotoxin-Sfo1a_1 n=1 Tax=Selenotholus foelschei TaxID=1905327 RepID=A0A482Z8E2_9ARAC
MKVSALTVIAAVMMAVALLAFGDEEINDDTEKAVGTSFRDVVEVLGLENNEEESRLCSREGEFCYKMRKCCSGLYCKAFVLHCYKN